MMPSRIASFPRLVVLTVCMLFVMSSAGCLGTKARDAVVTPALVMASEGVQYDAMSGVGTLNPEERPAATVIVDGFFSAVASKDRVRIAGEAMPSWPQVKSWALTGIAARQSGGGIGPGVAMSLRERLANFDAALMTAVERLE